MHFILCMRQSILSSPGTLRLPMSSLDILDGDKSKITVRRAEWVAPGPNCMMKITMMMIIIIIITPYSLCFICWHNSRKANKRDSTGT